MGRVQSPDAELFIKMARGDITTIFVGFGGKWSDVDMVGVILSL